MSSSFLQNNPPKKMQPLYIVIDFSCEPEPYLIGYFVDKNIAEQYRTNFINYYSEDYKALNVDTDEAIKIQEDSYIVE